MPIYHANCIYGYFQKDVPVFVNKKLKHCPHGQCGANINIRDEKRWIDLISYESLIFSYCPDDNTISFKYSQASPDYSRTTIKHVSAFCKEYIPAMSYHAIKKLYYEYREELENEYLKNDAFLLRDF